MQPMMTRMIRTTDTAGAVVEMSERAAEILRDRAHAHETTDAACCDTCAEKQRAKPKFNQARLY